jgi:hypothetical protein
MRGGEEAGLAGHGERVLVLGEDGIDKGAGASFALCSGDMDDVEAIQIRRLE